MINATGVWADQIHPEEIHDEEELRGSPRAAARTLTVSLGGLQLARAAIVPAGESRTIFALPWYGRALIGTTDNDYDGDIAHVRPGTDDITYLLDAVNAFFGLELTVADVTGAYAGVRPLITTGDPRKSVDISRKAELYETSSGMLTITGQADHVAADGEAGGRPDGRARGPSRALSDRPAARDGGLRPGLARPTRLGEDVLPPGYRSLLGFRYGHAARNVLQLAGERRSSRRRSSPASPTCSPRPRSRPGWSGRARSPTCCCAAPGSGCSRRLTCARPSR